MTPVAPVELPMFPLGSPLLPGQGLPLQVFEPRYHTLVERVLAADRRFGVVLITRGLEVGGGDLRADVGTAAEVLSHELRDDGRRLVLAVGTTRLRIVRWLRDDPHPRAEVEPWPDEDGPDQDGPDQDGPDEHGAEPGPGDRADLASLQARVDDLVALVAPHLDDDARGRLREAARLPDDAATAPWQAALVAELGPLDRQRLLECPDRARRLALLDRLLQERLDVLSFTLGDRPS